MVLNGFNNPKNKDFQFWEQNNHPIEIWSDQIFEQKVDYIHANPVEAGVVEYAEDWIWSSAIDYSGGKGLLELSWDR